MVNKDILASDVCYGLFLKFFRQQFLVKVIPKAHYLGPTIFHDLIMLNEMKYISKHSLSLFELLTYFATHTDVGLISPLS